MIRDFLKFVKIFLEDREGVKWELENAYILLGFHALALGFIG